MSEAKFMWDVYSLFCEECKESEHMGGKAADGEVRLFGDQVLGPLPVFMIKHAGHRLRILDEDKLQEVYRTERLKREK